MVDAITYVLRSGCAWRLLPHDFPPWQTVYGYFRTWRKESRWEQMSDVLRESVRAEAGRETEPNAAILDSQNVKTTETKGERGIDANKVVGRTFAWLGRYRRLGKDYEQLTQTSEAMICATMIRLMLKRLAANPALQTF